MTKRRTTNIWTRRLIIVIMAILVMLGSLRFFVDTCFYLGYSWNISSIESNAKQGYWTANGRVTWDEGHIKQYNNAVAEKEEFIESSDVAKFHHYSAFSKTGQVVRVATIIAAIDLLYNSVDILFVAIKCIIRHIVAAIKKVIRLRKRAYNRKKSRA